MLSFPRIRFFSLWAGLSVLFLFCCVAFAQEPVFPEDAAVVGYARLYSPKRCERSLDAFVREKGLPLGRVPLVESIERWLGDERRGLVRPLRPLTFCLLRDADGGLHKVMVLPEVSDVGYLERCVERVSRAYEMLPGMALVGSREALALAVEHRSTVQALHDSLHPADMTFYLSGEALAGREERFFAFLMQPGLESLVGLLELPPSQMPVALRNQQEEPQRWNRPGALAWLSVFARDMDHVTLWMDLEKAPSRLGLEYQAREGSTLASCFAAKSFANLSPEDWGATQLPIRYLPGDGALRVAWHVDFSHLEDHWAGWVEQAGRDLALEPERMRQWKDEGSDVWSEMAGAGALRLATGSLDGFAGRGLAVLRDYLLLAMRNSGFAPDQQAHLEGRIRQFLPEASAPAPTPPQAVAAVTLRSEIADVQALVGAGLSLWTGQAGKPLEKEAAEAIREFPTDRLHQGRREAFVLRVGTGLFLFAATHNLLREALARVLRLEALSGVLEAHRIFLPGGNLYGDALLHQAQDRALQVHFMLRFTERQAQGFVAIPR